MNDSNDKTNIFTNSASSFYNFDSFVEPSMLLSAEDVGDFGSSNGLELLDSIPSLPTEIPSIQDNNNNNSESTASIPMTCSEKSPSAAIRGPGSLYDQLTCPNSPALADSPNLYPYGSPYSMGSPSALMMSTTPTGASNDPSWMHSTRQRRRRSTFASPSLMTQSIPQSQFGMMMSSPSQLGLGFNSMNMPYGFSSPQMYPHPYMMGPPMSPMNVTVKLPMAPLTPTNYGRNDVSMGSMKIPLVLPCHLQQQEETQSAQNSAAPNVSKLQNSSTSGMSSGVSSRCSSIAPNSSVSSSSSLQNKKQDWFTEMSATKDKFLSDFEAIDTNNVTVMELKQVLRKFGLNSTGKKHQLIERITEISNFLKIEETKRAKVETCTE